MKILIYFLWLFFFCIGVFIPSIGFANDKELPITKIECGTATISGSFVNYNELKKQYVDFGNLQIYCSVSSSLTGNIDRKKIEIKDDGTFWIELPVDISHTVGTIVTNLADQAVYYISLVADEETKLDFYFENRTFSVKWVSGPNIIFGKGNDWAKAFREAMFFESSWGNYDLDTLKCFIIDPLKYASFTLRNNLIPRLKILAKAPMPKAIFELYEADIKLMTIPDMFYYRSNIWEMYTQLMKVSHNKQEQSDRIGITKSDSITYPPIPDISYWSFLKRFELNSSDYLYSGLAFYYFRSMLTLMQPAVPIIEEMPVDKWLKQTKSVLSDRIGFSKGQFYDVLVCIAYAQQFTTTGKPLSAQQIRNIKKYYKGGEVEKVLLRENKKIEERVKTKLLTKTKGIKLIDDVVSKYKGKVVVVDFWATWCGPCMNAMKEIDKIKSDYSSEDVVFVYITTESSPKDKWEIIKPTIKGEHYYLTKAEWEDALDIFKFKSIPAYVFYDKQGNVVDSMIGYPGNEKMKDLIKRAMGQ